MVKLTQKQFVFCSKYVELGNATEAALAAGYSARSSRFISSENLTKPNITERIEELRQKFIDESIADPIERRQILTEIVRGRFADFMTNLTPEKLKSAALQEIKIHESFGGKTTTIKLNDPAKAIDLLNKMDKLYTDGATVNVDSRTLNINVRSEAAKSLTEQITEGVRTEPDNGQPSAESRDLSVQLADSEPKGADGDNHH